MDSYRGGYHDNEGRRRAPSSRRPIVQREKQQTPKPCTQRDTLMSKPHTLVAPVRSMKQNKIQPPRQDFSGYQWLLGEQSPSDSFYLPWNQHTILKSSRPKPTPQVPGVRVLRNKTEEFKNFPFVNKCSEDCWIPHQMVQETSPEYTEPKWEEVPDYLPVNGRELPFHSTEWENRGLPEHMYQDNLPASYDSENYGLPQNRDQDSMTVPDDTKYQENHQQIYQDIMYGDTTTESVGSGNGGFLENPYQDNMTDSDGSENYRLPQHMSRNTASEQDSSEIQVLSEETYQDWTQCQISQQLTLQEPGPLSSVKLRAQQQEIEQPRQPPNSLPSTKKIETTSTQPIPTWWQVETEPPHPWNSNTTVTPPQTAKRRERPRAFNVPAAQVVPALAPRDVRETQKPLRATQQRLRRLMVATQSRKMNGMSQSNPESFRSPVRYAGLDGQKKPWRPIGACRDLELALALNLQERSRRPVEPGEALNLQERFRRPVEPGEAQQPWPHMRTHRNFPAGQKPWRPIGYHRVPPVQDQGEGPWQPIGSFRKPSTAPERQRPWRQTGSYREYPEAPDNEHWRPIGTYRDLSYLLNMAF